MYLKTVSVTTTLYNQQSEQSFVNVFHVCYLNLKVTTYGVTICTLGMAVALHVMASVVMLRRDSTVM